MAKTRTAGPRCCNTDALADPGPAAGVDPAVKAANLSRLKRVEAQIGRARKLIERGRRSDDVIRQLSAAQKTLRSVGRELLRDHLRYGAAAAMRSGGDGARKVCDQLVELFRKSRC